MALIKTFFLTVMLVMSLSAREQVNVNFSDLEIEDFIKLISKVTNKNILINNKIKGTVDFVSTVPVYDDELLGILISVLESKGFSLVKDGSLYQIVRSTELAKNNVRVASTGEDVYGALMVTQVIKIDGENVDIIAAKIRYLISTTAKLMTMKESNTLLITDYPKNITTIKKVIKDIIAENKFIVKILDIKYTDIKKLHAKLVDISKSLFNEKVEEEIVKIILDDNINGLVIVGKEENIATIETIVAKLDIEATITEEIKIFELTNSDSKTVLATLNAIVAKQKFADPLQKPNITSNDEINAIIVMGEPFIVKGISQIIHELDKEKYQVYVTARIIEVSKNEAENIGIKYGFAGGDVSSSGLYAMSGNFGASGLTNDALSVVVGALSSIGETARADTTSLDIAGNPVINPGTNVVTSAFALGATLDFLETNGASKAISNPSILCLNNKESSIYVGKTIAVSSGTTSSAAAGVTNSIKREDIGLELKIKPRVSSVDKVTLDVGVKLESILDDGSKNETGQPVTAKQEVKTQAILRHGENIIIGGLVKNISRDSVSKIPLLGDIPIIGKYLFSSSSVIEEEDSLVVILTPYIIDKSEELSKLQRELGRLAEIQEEYNKEIFDKLEKQADGAKETRKVETPLDENDYEGSMWDDE
ncbi:MAG: hypothetical protein H8E76_08975 [Helicobacteraceae bacterium]|nr:hypothetical protein [Candidatus Sulfurimonas ponti]